jgi:hypothetical protein
MFRFGKSDTPIFPECRIWTSNSPSLLLQINMDLQIFTFSSFLRSYSETTKTRDSCFSNGIVRLFSLAKFGHQHSFTSRIGRCPPSQQVASPTPPAMPHRTPHTALALHHHLSPPPPSPLHHHLSPIRGFSHDFSYPTRKGSRHPRNAVEFPKKGKRDLKW